jgi:hypothetical protein
VRDELHLHVHINPAGGDDVIRLRQALDFLTKRVSALPTKEDVAIAIADAIQPKGPDG